MKKLRKFLRSGVVKAYLCAADLLYHNLAGAYDGVAWLVSFGYWSDWRSDSLKYLLPGAILETGFGTGSLLIEMVEGDLDVIGLEISKDMHRVAGRKIKRKDIKIKRVLGRTEAIPFPNCKFENVLSTFPSNYVFDKRTCDEVHRVLASPGRWVIAGLGMQFKSGIKKTLSSWIWGKYDIAFIMHLAEKMESAGFSSSIILHETDQYIFPMVLMTSHDA